MGRIQEWVVRGSVFAVLAFVCAVYLVGIKSAWYGVIAIYGIVLSVMLAGVAIGLLAFSVLPRSKFDALCEDRNSLLAFLVCSLALGAYFAERLIHFFA